SHIEGKVTGTHAHTTLRGTLTGHELQRDNVTALAMTSEYEVEVPDLAIGRATAEATIGATFVQAGSAKIHRLTSKIKYAGSTVDVVAKVEQPQRTITADAEV